MRAFAVINPKTRGGRGVKIWPGLRAHLTSKGWTVADATADRQGHEVELASDAARDGYDVVFAVGGDGTAHHVANGLLAQSSRGNGTPRLAVIPTGTGNDLAASLGLPKDPQAALASIIDGHARRIDVGRVNDRYFLTIGMVGFGAEVARQVNEWPRPLPGPVMYVGGVLKMLATFSPVEMEVSFDGNLRRQRLFMLAMGNTHRAAGGMKLCPSAKPDDGLMEVLLIGDVTKPEVLSLLPKTFSGTHIHHPKVEVLSASSVVVHSPSSLAVQADGEVLGRVPATFTVLPGGLEVLVP